MLGMLSGALGAVGILILLQQFGTMYPTRNAAIVGLVLGAVLGLGVPMLAGRRAASQPAADATGSALPAEPLAEPALDSPMPAPALAARAPAEGLRGWAEPDPELPAVTVLEGGSTLAVRERRGDWALVEGEAGTTTWVDGRLLVWADPDE